MTLTELSQAWNDLRNAALGRGVAPLVPAALAAEVGQTYERWRAYLTSLGPLSGTLQESLVDDPLTSTAYPWLTSYRAVAAKVRAAGITFKSPDKTLLEGLPDLPGQIGDQVKTIAIATAAVLVPLLLFALFSRVRGR